MGNNRARGFGYEREVVNLAKSKGLVARRAWGSDGRTLGLTADVDIIIEGLGATQAKRVKKLPAYLHIPSSCAGVVFRMDRGESFILLRLDEYLDKLAERKNEEAPAGGAD